MFAEDDGHFLTIQLEGHNYPSRLQDLANKLNKVISAGLTGQMIYPQGVKREPKKFGFYYDFLFGVVVDGNLIWRRRTTKFWMEDSDVDNSENIGESPMVPQLVMV